MTGTTTESLADIMHDANMLRAQGKRDEADEVMKKIPIYPPGAWSIKRLFGAKGLAMLQEMERRGYDMSEVVARYGSDFLKEVEIKYGPDFRLNAYQRR
jgi:hypothetical protein